MRRLRWAGIYVLCLIVVLFVRTGLWIVRYQRVRAFLVRPCPPDAAPERKATVARITRAISRVARLVPDATCLTQTIAAQAVLSWKGIPTTIAMGMRHDAETGFGAHAWLIWNGLVVMEGDADSVEGFARILDLPTPTVPPVSP